MIIFKKAAELREFLARQTQAIGFVPTMGALHAGHRSLIDRARADGRLTVCSIFVNPTQFNDRKDYETYPSTVDEDIQVLLDAGCDVLFLPSEAEVYPDGPGAVQAYHFGPLETVLEGAHRPGHFRGVGQVVGRLLDLVQPQFLYMGQKDYQQCLVIKDLLRQTGSETEMIMAPTVREPDGLAMSSRNRRLTEPQRALAGVIYQCLVSIRSKQEDGSFPIVQKECRELMERKGFEPEYIELADATNLQPLNDFSTTTKTAALIAARLGGVRLIDNVLL